MSKILQFHLKRMKDGLVYLPRILVEVELLSNGEARRLIDGGIQRLINSLFQQRL